MSDKRRRAKILAIVLIAAVALGAAAFLLRDAGPSWLQKTPFARSENAADDSTPIIESEIEKIARAWTANNINGAAGDEIVNLIVRKSNTEQPDMLREYLRERVEPATDWSYGQVAMASENVYELTATASTLVHEMMPPPIFTFADGGDVPTPAPAGYNYRRVATAPFRLTVNADTMSVTDWRLRSDAASVIMSFGSKMNAATVNNDGYMTVQGLYDEKTADCINAAMAENLTEQDATTLFIPPNHRKESDAARLKAVVNSAGLGEVCADWIGE